MEFPDIDSHSSIAKTNQLPALSFVSCMMPLLHPVPACNAIDLLCAVRQANASVH